MNAYLFAIREHADDERLEAIEKALRAPSSERIDGVPLWYGSDDDAWAEWQHAARAPLTT